MKKLVLGLTLFSSVALAGCSDPSVASSTAGQISQSDLYEEMKETVGSQVLQQMLIEDVLEKRYGDNVSTEDVEAELQAEQDRLGGEEQFEGILASQGLTMESYSDTVRLYLLMQEAVIENAEVTDEDLKEYYDNYEPPITASHILVEDEETAQDIISKLQNDEATWDELVQEHSVDTASVPDNGQMTFSKGEMVEEFEEAALALEEGEITEEPVESQFGYHIIRLDEAPEKGTFEEEKENMRELYLLELMADSAFVQESIGKAMDAENVIIEDDELQGAIAPFMPGSDSSSDSSEEDVEESDAPADPEEETADTDTGEDANSDEGTEEE